MKTALRWTFLASGLVWAAASVALSAEQPFDYNVLKARAKALAEKPHVKPTGEVPEWLRNLSYDDLRRIEFDGRESLWLRDKLPFQAQFLHPGFLFDKTVHLHEVQQGRAAPISFQRKYFQYRTVKNGEVPENFGFAGFRLMFPFAGPGNDPNEIGAFAGASYFRFLSEKASYGLSARGLALNTAEPSRGIL